MMRSYASAARVLGPIALSVAFLGCPPEPTSPSVGLTGPINPPQPPDLGNYVDRDITVHVFLTENLRHYCTGPDPFFHYDSDRITPQDQPSLYALAACMQDGPLKGRRIELIGRADPRGSEAYNDKLGLERAERVKLFLVNQGIAADRVETASRGKADALQDKGKWRTDRRVDIDLLP